ncbi:hypothetical protein GGX14DRAFT_602560 [Mycena pura]|uniref:Uncharacterized protein n=1 Tax=Mycena pura TaxID=153505 RepID=A0AAD6VQG3_9AGAR|nr:hypothetical protein GGX14DRAFT_602560 [Mycena pura]
MASRLSRQAFSTTARVGRSVRSNVHPPRRLMSADAAGHHEFKPTSDMPWVIGAVIVSGPLLAYLLRDTVAIKKRIAAGDHGHGHGHDAHGNGAHTAGETHEEHATPAVMKDDEGTPADVTSSIENAEASDVPKAAGATTSDKPSADDKSSADAVSIVHDFLHLNNPREQAAEPPRDEKEAQGGEKDGAKKESTEDKNT